MVIALTTFVMASTIFSGLNKLFKFLESLVQLGPHTGNLSSLGINFCLPLSGIVGQMFLIPTIHSCSCYTCLCALLPPAKKHQGQPTPKLCKTLGVRGRQTLSPGHHSKVGVSQILSKLMLQSLVGLTYEFRLLSYNFSDQNLQLISKSILGFLDLLRLVVKISYQGVDHLT